MSDQNNYSSELSSYVNRLNTFKSDATSAASKVGQASRTAVSSLGAPLGVGLIKDGVKTIVNNGKLVAKKTLKDAASRLKAKAANALEDAKSQVTDAVDAAKGNVRDAVQVARRGVQDARSAVQTTVQDASTSVPQITGDAASAAVGNGEVALEPVAASVGRSAVSNSFTNADVDAMTSAQKTSYLQAFQGEPVTDLGSLPEGALEHALAARASSISKGILSANEGELAPVASAVRAPLLGGLRGDSTIARALAPPPEPIPDEPPSVPAATRVVDGSADDAVTPGVGDEVNAAKTAAKAAVQVGEKSVGSDLVEAGETIAATTGVESGGLGELVGGLVAAGGAIASALVPHKMAAKAKSLATSAIQVGV